MRRAALSWGLLVNASAVIASCSGQVSTDGAAGHAGADAGSLPSGGSAGTGVNGGGGVYVPMAQGNLTLNVQYEDLDLCPVTDKTYVVGAPEGPSSMTPGIRLIDGEGGAKISCAVNGTGPYTFSGTIQATTPELDSVTFTISDGVVNADGLTGSASLSVTTTDLVGSYSSGFRACPIRVVDDQIKRGSIWATFSCDLIWPSAIGVCTVGESAFVFENCDGT